MSSEKKIITGVVYARFLSRTSLGVVINEPGVFFYTF